MKILIILLSIIFTTSLLYSQSSFVTDIGTTIDIGSGTDICADVITINGTLTGNGTFCNAPVAVENENANENDLGTPKEFSISQNYPNPFNPSTIIQYAIPTASNVKIEIFNITGERITKLVDGFKNEGYYEVSFNASSANDGLPSGMYLYRISADAFVQTKKMILMK